MGDKLIPSLIGNPYNGYINPYYWVDEFIPYDVEKNGSLDPGTYGYVSMYIWSGLLFAVCKLKHPVQWCQPVQCISLQKNIREILVDFLPPNS